MKRILIFAYGVFSYAVFFVTFLYAIGFVMNIGVPKTIDSAPQLPVWKAIAIDSLLLGLFAVQHSIMARPGFKRWWTGIVSKPAERSTYVLFSSAALILLFALWQPIGIVIWNVQQPVAWTLLFSLGAAGWVIVLITTCLISHFDLFGLRQVWFYLRQHPYEPVKFSQPGPYKYVRHPMYIGWLLAFWATPTMTAAHLVFAVLTTAYILIAIRLEERDLIIEHGEQYRRYRRYTPMLIPRFSKRTSGFHPADDTA